MDATSRCRRFICILLLLIGDLLEVKSYNYIEDYKTNQACKITLRYGATIELQHTDHEVVIGDKIKFRCAPLPEKKTTVEWFKNGDVLSSANGRIIKRKKKKRKNQRLIIRDIKLSDSGCYSCYAPRKGGLKLIKSWKLVVTNYKAKPSTPLTWVFTKQCGGPRPRLVSRCHRSAEWTHPKCNTFPGMPENLQAISFFHNGNPVVQITWEPPKKGFEYAWGYHVHLLVLGEDYYYQCVQINARDERLYWTFTKNIKPHSMYRLFVQSLPAKHYGNRKNIASIKIMSASKFPKANTNEVEREFISRSNVIRHKHKVS